MSFFNIITYFLGNCKSPPAPAFALKTFETGGDILWAAVAAPPQALDISGIQREFKQSGFRCL